MLTSHRLLWARPGEIGRGGNAISLKLKYVQSLDDETASSGFFGKKKRIILNLAPVAADKGPGPLDQSTTTFIKLSGKSGMDPRFVSALQETVAARVWEVDQSPEKKSSDESPVPRIKLRTGIVGIERNLQERQKQTDESISLAFKDLNKLMTMAKDMVAISKVISTRIREKQGDINDNETIRFKSYLMSLGIDDPVTREGVQNESEYFQKLAQQITEMMLDPVTESGGIMALADVFCRVNRARGLELLSPEDLINACRLMSGPIKLRIFPSGSAVLQLESHDDETVAQETKEIVEQVESISAEDLAKQAGISILLSMERLLTTERAGYVCRDESIEGLRFYPNLFLQKV